MCDIVVKKFTFAISSPDEFLYCFAFTMQPNSDIECSNYDQYNIELRDFTVIFLFFQKSTLILRIFTVIFFSLRNKWILCSIPEAVQDRYIGLVAMED